MRSKYIFSKDEYLFYFIFYSNVATHDEKQCNKISYLSSSAISM